jgi:hypothetical protein
MKKVNLYRMCCQCVVIAIAMLGPACTSVRSELKVRPLVLATEAKKCFEPLDNPQGRDLKDWKDLIEHAPTEPKNGTKRFLLLTDDENKGAVVNLDFYAISFSAHSTLTMEKFFSQIRSNFPVLVQGPSKTYNFGPYGTGDVLDTNRKLWEKPEHKGAVMSFILFDPVARVLGTGASFDLIRKRGDVQSTCASPVDFIFTTIESSDNGAHPVAGHRGFGIMKSSSDTWTFYSKATDRTSGFRMNGSPEDTFAKGARFWDFFYDNMKRYLDREGLKVRGSVIKNRCQPDAWPVKYDVPPPPCKKPVL